MHGGKIIPPGPWWAPINICIQLILSLVIDSQLKMESGRANPRRVRSQARVPVDLVIPMRRLSNVLCDAGNVTCSP